MKTALVVRHVAFEDLGTFAPVLAAAGYTVTWHEAGVAPLPATAAGAELVVILGGPIGVYDVGDYPFLRDEIELARVRIAHDAPTLGICLGSQIMAAAGGARVYPGDKGKEIGWAPLTLTREGVNSPLAEIAPTNTKVLHWHGDTFDLPANGRLLASTELYPHQAFAIGHRSLALQFHPEVSASRLEQWYIGHTLEIATTPGISVAGLRAEGAAAAPALERQGPKFLARWLAEITP